jgi:uncharacterized protein (TIGR03435 family)
MGTWQVRCVGVSGDLRSAVVEFELEFTVVQEQLGLKLEPAKAPLDVIVIDHIERPSEN